MSPQIKKKIIRKKIQNKTKQMRFILEIYLAAKKNE